VIPLPLKDWELLSKGWRQTALQILHEAEKEHKLDEVEKIDFLNSLKCNLLELMEKRGCLQCSASGFVKKLKTTDPKAFKMLKKKSLNPEIYSQKGHKYLIGKAKEKFKQNGYEVYGGKSKKALEKLRKLNGGWLVDICQGKDRYPDLIAFRNSEVLIVEVASWKTRLVRQLNNYDQMLRKTLLVLPVSTENLEIWGLSELYEEQQQSRK